MSIILTAPTCLPCSWTSTCWRSWISTSTSSSPLPSCLCRRCPSSRPACHRRTDLRRRGRRHIRVHLRHPSLASPHPSGSSGRGRRSSDRSARRGRPGQTDQNLEMSDDGGQGKKTVKEDRNIQCPFRPEGWPYEVCYHGIF